MTDSEAVALGPTIAAAWRQWCIASDADVRQSVMAGFYAGFLAAIKDREAREARAARQSLESS